jgi:hypothetical protein
LADVVLLTTVSYHFVPLNNVINQLVYCDNGISVTDVMIDGRWVLRQGKLLTIDEKHLYARARVLREEMEDHLREQFRQPLSQYSSEPIQCWPLSLGADMRRREFIILLGGGAAAAWPLVVRAQQPARLWKIGVLANESWPPLEGLRHGLRDLGYVEGKNQLKPAFKTIAAVHSQCR